MHLNNDQLLEPDEGDLSHLSKCEVCRSRAENLSIFRSRLQSMPEKLTPIDQWQSIQSSYYAQAGITELVSARRTATFWKVASGAIAASFAVFMLWQTFYQAHDADMSSQDVVITALIKENNVMQQQLGDQLTVQRTPNIKTTGLLVELEVINAKLQQAYLEKQSEEQKLHLWQQRQILLQTILSAIKQPHVIEL
ncbi:MAG: hypothetical protein QNK31_09135 [Porticoccus sp.]|nr:hypothetical protein [Porticoccus sp.]